MSPFTPIPTLRLVAVVALTSCVGCGGEVAEPAPPLAVPVHVEAAISVASVPVAHATATLEPLRQVVLAPLTAGVVREVHFRLGRSVSEGELLLRIDGGVARGQATLASVDVAQAAQQEARAQVELRRALALSGSGAIPQSALEDAQAALGASRLAYRAARTRYRLARRGVRDSVLRAPFSGVVASRQVEVGALVAAGTPVGTLVDNSLLRATLLLDPAVGLDVRVGADVTMTPYARPDTQLIGRVRDVGAAVDPGSRRLPIEVEFTPGDTSVVAGLLARFEVALGPARDVVRVQPDAVFEFSGAPHVYVIEDGSVRRRAVRLGATSGNHAEVLDGLRSGDRVVVAGLARLSEGAHVRVVEPRTETLAVRR